jgi:hypothetical protein
MIDILIGAVTFASFTVGLIFFRFWYNTRDQFFLYFALSFWLEGLNRLHAGITEMLYDDMPVRYFIRLVSYGLILLAIWEKNRPLWRKRAD